MTTPLPPTAEHYATMMSYVQGGWVAQTARTVAALSIPETLAAGPRTADQIAHDCGSAPSTTFRLLRACVALDLATYDETTGTFAATPLLTTLSAGTPHSLRGMALVQTAPGHWNTWGRMTDAVRTGNTQIQEVLGGSLWDYLATQQHESEMFSEAMTNLTGPVAPEAAKVIDTAGLRSAIDLGGANGTFLYELLHRNPELHGTVLDLPHAITAARQEAERQNLTDRALAQAGNFFESVPTADLYLLKFILHDWDDESCIRILRNCRAAMNATSRLCIVDMVVGETTDPGRAASLMDMNMLALFPGGKERNLTEFDTLLTTAGLQRTTTTPITHPYSVIEATPTHT